MSGTIDIINAYNEQLNQIYLKQDIKCLSDEGYQFQGENVIAINNPAVVAASKAGLIDYLNDVCDSLNIDRELKNPNTNQFELFTATADIKYRLGTLFLYQPYITILANSYGYLRGEKHFRYNQTREDARFNRELPIAFEGLYKFWQRLGDYLSNFFPELILEKKAMLYFHAPFLHIHAKYPQLEQSENYNWLKNFAENQYPGFNKHRKFFVHYTGYDTHYFSRFLEANGGDEAAIAKLDKERVDWLPYLKEQLNLCNEGYLKMMYFLNEIAINPNQDGTFDYQL